MYLGSDYKNYQKIGLPAYFVNTLSTDYLPADAMKGWLFTEFDFERENADLISTFIHHGKLMYILDALLPNTEDSIKFAYSGSALRWCKDNEFNLWAHFIDNQLLYSKDQKQISKYLAEGPFTSGLPKESPAQVGIWVGREIVRAFMENNPKTTLSELVLLDCQQLFKNSTYKPSR